MNAIERIRCAALTVLAAWTLPTWAVETIPTERFATLPDFEYVRLSPDGTRVAAVANVFDDAFAGRIVVQQNLRSGERKSLIALPDGEYKFNWIRWAADNKLLVSIRTREARFGAPFTSTKMLVIDTDSGEASSALSNRTLLRARWLPQFQDQVIDILPEDGQHILMQADMDAPNMPGVYRVDVDSGHANRINKGRKNITGWITDRQHRVRVATYLDETTIRVYEQDTNGKNWRMLWEYEALSADAVEPMGFASDPNTLYVKAYHEGRKAVFRVDLSDDELSRELVFADDERDVSGRLIYSPKNRDVVGISTGIGDAYEFWSDEHKRLIGSINAALPERYNAIVSISANEQWLVLLSESDTDAGTYYVLNRSTMQMSPIAARYGNLPAELMARKASIRYEARDGTSIQAFVTLPKDIEPKGLPAVVYPHGGPISFDSGGFDHWAQLYANRGYAVIQMNFRGSAGFGYEFMAAGLQNWGLEMQDDVADAAHWLIDNGIADPERICIVGGSYGGYAALMGAAKTPDLFRCAVSFAGVADLSALVRESRHFTIADIAKLQLGSKQRDLKARSPINHADSIDIPVLLVHGQNDVIVRVEHSQRMASALKRAGKDVTYIEQEEGDHFLSTNEQRLEAMQAIEVFLAKHLGQPAL